MLIALIDYTTDRPVSGRHPYLFAWGCGFAGTASIRCKLFFRQSMWCTSCVSG